MNNEGNVNFLEIISSDFNELIPLNFSIDPSTSKTPFLYMKLCHHISFDIFYILNLKRNFCLENKKVAYNLV